MATASQPSRRRLSRPLLVALCAVAAGCGGQEAPPPDGPIATAVKRVLQSDNVEDQCETGVSERFVREIYLTLAQCRRTNARPPDDRDAPPDRAQISATRIDGDRATTGVTLTSDRGARATGRLALVRVGSTWKVDRLGTDFLRSMFATLPEEGETAQERRILACLAQATGALPDAAVRRIGNLVLGQRLTKAALPPRATLCIRGAAGAAAGGDDVARARAAGEPQGGVLRVAGRPASASTIPAASSSSPPAISKPRAVPARARAFS